ncbi:MAG: PQQ-binding-like beta-propeller repeat protein, partial [Anaerolineae bacterium]
MDSKSTKTTKQKILIFTAILLVFLAAGGALFLPWLLDKGLGGDVVDQYDPYTAGRSALFIITDSAGTHTGWESHNNHAVPSAFLFELILEDEVYPALSSVFGLNPDETELLSQFTNNILQTVRKSVQVIDVEGNPVEVVNRLFVRSEHGEHLLFDLDPDPTSESISVYTPPPLIWPASLPSNKFSTDRIVGAYAKRSQAFTHQLTVETLAQVPAEWKPFEPCVIKTLQLDLSAATNNLLRKQTHCTTIGLVQEERLNEDGEVVETLTLVSSSAADLAQNPISNWPHVPAPSKKNPAISQTLNAWEITRFADLEIAGFKTAPSQPLTLISASQPLLISARTSGGSIALNINTGKPDWSFTTENTIYGTPSLNPHNGLIYFGSSDKNLYAVTEHGMYVDSIRTNDNIITRPVFGENTIWFASEDGKIYCTSADLNPENLTTLDLVSPVVASPVVWKNLAVFGGDNGSLIAVDKECNPQWEYSAGDPIDAPLVIDDAGIIYFVGHGQMGAIDAASGSLIWDNTVEAPMHFAPTLT